MTVFELDGRRPNLPPADRVFIADSASVIGDVTLGDEANVWFGAVLRGDNDRIVIGARTNIQDHCVLHVDPNYPLDVGADCTIGHRAILHGCTIGEGALIGMGAIVLNGARIGRNSLVGAGALVTEGKEFPEGVLIVGSPARVVRNLSEDQLGWGRSIAAKYVLRGRSYRAGLRAISPA
jgi:carbonic anhydrase/acetyltransferase-like protein (isoleucine patch superfamily)